MHSLAVPSRSAGISGRAPALLAAGAVALVTALGVAFVVAPRVLAGIRPDGGFADKGDLVGALRTAFVGYWGSGDRDFSPGLESLVDYWVRYHVAKAGIAALLLVVFAGLGVLLWKTFLRAGGLGAGKRAALASAGGLVSVLALFSLATVMANIQGAISPFASLLSLLPVGETVGETDGELARTLGQVRQGLADSRTAGDQTPPALDVMISDFACYHVVMAVISAIVAAVVIRMSVVSWKRFAGTARSDRRTRRVWAAFGGFSALVSLVVIVVAVANTGTAADPAPALLAFFDGGL